MLAQLVPVSLRRELYRPRIGLENGAMKLTVRALDDTGTPILGEAELDGVDLGPVGMVYRVPACATEVSITDRRRGMTWTREVKLAGHDEVQVSGVLVASCGAGPYDTFASGRDDGCASGSYDCFTGQVYDHSSDLTWLRGVPPDTTLEEAQTACESLNPGNGWRLPTVGELSDLVQAGAAPQIDLDAFPGTPSEPFWTSEATELNATTVDFQTGAAVEEANDGSTQHGFRCVHPSR